MAKIVATILVTAFITWHLAWAAAHNTIATECEKLGSFYVGDKVYVCKFKE